MDINIKHIFQILKSLHFVKSPMVRGVCPCPRTLHTPKGGCPISDPEK